jgi:hypothetical protein
MLKPTHGHDKSTYGIYRYLYYGTDGRQHRMRAESVQGMFPREWWKQMDATREAYGNNRDHKNKPARTYEHFILSANPKDRATAQQMLDTARDWVIANFGDGFFKDGILGNYESAIVIHDDNTHHIMHAHIIVNNTNVNNGKRRHINNRQNADLTHSAEEIFKGHGLHYFEDKDTDGNYIPRNQQDHISRTEMEHDVTAYNREIYGKDEDDIKPLHSVSEVYDRASEHAKENKDYHGWKLDTISRINAAFEVAKDYRQFMAVLDSMGVDVKRSKDGRDLQYHIRDAPKSQRVNGITLGDNYSASGVRERYTQDGLRGRTHDGISADAHRRVMDKFTHKSNGFTVIGYYSTDKDMTLYDIAKAYSFINSNRISALDDFERIAKRHPGIDREALDQVKQIAKDADMVPEHIPARYKKSLADMSTEEITNELSDYYRQRGFGGHGTAWSQAQRAGAFKANQKGSNAGGKERSQQQLSQGERGRQDKDQSKDR